MSLYSANTSIESCFAISTKKMVSWVSMHINAFFSIRKIADEHFGTSELLIAIVKQAVVGFHLMKLAILEQS